MKNNLCLDRRCSLNGCWYCKCRCHICMKVADQVYSLGDELGFTYCSAECKSIIDNVSQLSAELHPLKQVDKKCLILAYITGCLATVLSTHTIVQINICISVEKNSINYGRPYATVQLQTQEQSVLFSVYLCNTFSPTQPVDEFPMPFTFQLLNESNLLTKAFQMSLHPLQIFSVSDLLRDATKADFTLAKIFSISCSPYER